MKQVAKRGFFHRKGRVGMKKRRSKTGSVLLFLLIFLLAAFMAFPLYYTVIQSLKPIEEIFRFPPTLYVSRPVMDNYGEMFRILANMWVPLSRYLFNTLFIAVLGTGLHVLVAGMAAYPLAKHNFPGRNLIFGVIMLGLLFVNQVTFVPSFVIIAKLDILNTYLAYLLPTIGVSLGLFLMRQFISQLPDSMLEAAKIDGANWWQIFTKITMPYIIFVLTPYLITTFTGNVNNFNVIYLLSGGDPTPLGDSAGSTDLLITWLYKLTVDKQDYNLGAVIGIMTFVVLAIVSLITYRNSGSYKNEEAFR